MLGVPDELQFTVYPAPSPEDAALLSEGRRLIRGMHALNVTKLAAQVRDIAARMSAEAKPFADALVADANLFEEGLTQQGAARRADGLHPVTDHLRHLVTPEEEAEAGLT